jgi:hypothetical protein
MVPMMHQHQPQLDTEQQHLCWDENGYFLISFRPERVKTLFDSPYQNLNTQKLNFIYIYIYS